MSFLIAMLLAQAGAAKVEPEPDCANTVVQQEMNYCAAQDFHAADAALNEQWRITAAEMRRRDAEPGIRDNRREDWPGYFETLLAAQRAWLTYRDNHCDSEGYRYWGGSMEPLIVAGCRTSLTQDRTQQLRELLGR